MKRFALSALAWIALTCWTLLPLVCVFGMAWAGPWASRTDTGTVLNGTGSGLHWLRSSDGSGVRIAVRNSFGVATIAALVVVICGVPAGYVLGASWKVHTSTLSGLVLGRALPSCAIIMPILSFCLALKITGSPSILVILHSALVLPLLVALVARQPWDQVRLVEQAAYLDGARPVRVKIQLWIVASLPTIAVGFILAWLESWKEFGFAVMLLGGDSATLPVVMAGFESIRGVEWGRLATTLLIAVLPSVCFALCIAALARRYFTFGGSRNC